MSAGDATARLHEAIDLVAGIDVSDLPTPEALGELLEELTRCTRRLDFELHRLLRSFEARGDHIPSATGPASSGAVTGCGCPTVPLVWRCGSGEC